MNFDKESKSEDFIIIIFFFWGGGGGGGGGGSWREEGYSNQNKRKYKNNTYSLFFVLMLYINFKFLAQVVIEF